MGSHKWPRKRGYRTARQKAWHAAMDIKAEAYARSPGRRADARAEREEALEHVAENERNLLERWSGGAGKP